MRALPVHEQADRQADGEVHRHDDGDALDRLPGLVEGGAGHRDHVLEPDRDGEGGIIGPVGSWLVIGGMITRSACGSTTSRRMLPGRRPSAFAASVLAVRHRLDAGRTISAMKAAV